MCGTVFNGCLRALSLEKSVRQTRSKAIAATNAIIDLEVLALHALKELTLVVEDGTPIVERRGSRLPQRGCGDLEVREVRASSLDHPLEAIGLDLREMFIGTLDVEAEACGEVLFVADHDVDVLRDVAVHALCAFLAALAFPQGCAVVQIIGDHGTVLLRHFDRFDNCLSGIRCQCCKDSTCMEPAHTFLSENLLPVHLTGLDLRCR